MADERTYIRVHDGMPDHPKIDPLSDAAFRLLISGWAWCSRHLTDGVMPAGTWAKRGKAKARAELLAAELVEDHGQTVHFHDYLEHQRSAAQVAVMKEQRRTAGRAGGLAKGKRGAKRVAKQTASETPSKTEASTETKSSSNEEDVPPRIDVEQICAAVVAAEERKGSKRPTISADWRRQARLMLDTDKRALDDVLAVIDWTADHDFWRANIRSVPKLREQFDTLRLQRETSLRQASGAKPWERIPAGQEHLPEHERFRIVGDQG